MVSLIRLGKWASWVLAAVSVALVCFIIIVVTLQVFSRKVDGLSLVWTEESARILLIWFTMVAAGWLAYTGEHIGLGLGGYVKDGRNARIREIAVRTLGTIVLICLAVTSATALNSFNSASAALRFPDTYLYLSFTVGCALWAIFNALSILRLVMGYTPHGEVIGPRQGDLEGLSATEEEDTSSSTNQGADR